MIYNPETDVFLCYMYYLKDNLWKSKSLTYKRPRLGADNILTTNSIHADLSLK